MRKFWMGILVVMIVCLVAGRVGGGASPFGAQGKQKAVVADVGKPQEPARCRPTRMAETKPEPVVPAAEKYEATIESLDTHPLPDWYADAKLGIFIHWGLYSVPGWAVLTPEKELEKLPVKEYVKRNPYAEWYYNTMRLDGSPTQEYHKEHYGADYNYYNFAETFDKEIQKWNPEVMASAFKMAGARYVVLTTKHHEGFTLWPSDTPNPTLPKDRQHATRDLVGELAAAVREKGMRMGVYYSGGYDWTFVPGPITDWKQAKTIQPQSEAYGKYADAHMRELIAKYKPSILWNDIDYPKTGHPLEIMAEFYNANPEGVVDDRFGVKHADFVSPEYETLKKVNKKKWEECRGLGRSFGYNRAEGEGQTIAKDALIYLLVDIVSKNGNLLLDVGPEADGTIPRGATGPVEGAGGVVGGEWRRDLWDASVEAGGGQDPGWRGRAVHAEGRRGVCVCVGRAAGKDRDDPGFEDEEWRDGDGVGRRWHESQRYMEAGRRRCGGGTAGEFDGEVFGWDENGGGGVSCS